MAGQRRKLTVFDRSMIEVRFHDGWGVRAIARDLDRSMGMILDEINRRGGAIFYHAQAVRIPIQGGHVFRFDPGHPTDLMAATIPL